MKHSLRFMLTAWCLVFGIHKSNAQYVTLPQNIVVWLHNHGYSSCITGNQLDTTCPAVLSTISLDCSFQSLTSLEGIQYFDNLQVLQCNNNQLTSLPSLPASLIQLHAQNNQLVSLPPLPEGLSVFYCQYNQLTALPSLPANLYWFKCQQNQIAVMPSLPAGLVIFKCDDNQLSALPSLPPGLMLLHCAGNQLTALPSLPDSLYTLWCQVNQLTALPELPSKLTSLQCNENQLTALPDLPAGLTELQCQYNDLTALPVLPATLMDLRCQYNDLTSLPGLPAEMSILDISNNPGISCLPPIEKLTGSTAASSIGNTGITCLPNVIQHSGSIPSIDTLPVCGIFNPSGCPVAWNISGSVFKDDNGDCSALSNDAPLGQVKMVLTDSDGAVVQQVYSVAGAFSFDAPLGTYAVRVDTSDLPFNVVCPGSGVIAVTTDVNDSLAYGKDFSLQCKPNGFDLRVKSAVMAGPFFPGQPAIVKIKAGDAVAAYFGGSCNTNGVSGTVQATMTGPVSVTGASGNGVVSGNVVVWSVADLSLIAPGSSFNVSVTTDSTAQAGDVACVTAVITGNSGTDNDPSNDTLNHCFEVLNSYDPNDKQVYPNAVQQPGDWHTYTVRFQNTGTAQAFNILIIDTLDANLDWPSFELLGSSHANLTQVKPGGIVHFNFPNIMLPDSNTNEPASHGWIQYRIKTNADIQPGTVIHNTAAIYFDFNDPVLTNDAVLTYCLPVETQQAAEICEGDTVQVGTNWYHQPGTYTDAFTNQLGCDSVVVTNVVFITVSPAVTASGNTLTASGGIQFQWIDCNTNQPIAGATNASFTAAQNGSYAALVTDANGCGAQTECINIAVNGINAFHPVYVDMYPNPSSGTVHFDLRSHQGVLTVYSTVGQVIETRTVDHAMVTLVDLPNGLLTFKFVSDGGALHQGAFVVRD